MNGKLFCLFAILCVASVSALQSNIAGFRRKPKGGQEGEGGPGFGKRPFGMKGPRDNPENMMKELRDSCPLLPNITTDQANESCKDVQECKIECLFSESGLLTQDNSSLNMDLIKARVDETARNHTWIVAEDVKKNCTEKPVEKEGPMKCNSGARQMIRCLLIEFAKQHPKDSGPECATKAAELENKMQTGVRGFFKKFRNRRPGGQSSSESTTDNSSSMSSSSSYDSSDSTTTATTFAFQ